LRRERPPVAVLTEVAEVPEVRVELWLIEPDDAPDVPPDGRVASEGRASLAGAGSSSALGAPGSTMRRIVGEGGGPRSGAAAGAGIMGAVVRRGSAHGAQQIAAR